MVVSDPIADMLTRIRNAAGAKHETVAIPASKMKIAIAKILKEEGFIRDFQIVPGVPQKGVKLLLNYHDRGVPAISGLKRVSKPGLRVYVPRSEIPRVFGGLGIAVLSTPQGVMTGREAWRRRVGGEVLCYIW